MRNTHGDIALKIYIQRIVVCVSIIAMHLFDDDEKHSLKRKCVQDRVQVAEALLTFLTG